MQLQFSQTSQIELEQAAIVREVRLPDIRPISDAELEVTFIRAAVAWARWRERKRWAGR